MGIKRVELRFEKNFTRIPNEWARDHRLTLKARGLLLEIMSHAVGWNVTVEGLIRGGLEGRESIRNAIKELENLDYLKRVRDYKDGRLAGSHYELNDPAEGRVTRLSGELTVGPPVRKEELLTTEDQVTTEEVGVGDNVVSPTGERPPRQGWNPSPAAMRTAEANVVQVDIPIFTALYEVRCAERGVEPSSSEWLRWLLRDEAETLRNVRAKDAADRKQRPWHETASS